MITIKEYVDGVTNKALCVDCGVDHPIKLGCIRNGKSLQQCPNCFETYRQWSLKEISIKEVRDIYKRRLLKNVDIKGIA